MESSNILPVSIVIPTLNEETTLPVILDCIRQQTYQPLEVLIADAGSTDRTEEIARQFGALVIPGGLPGPGRNAGTRKARGEWLLFLDADVTFQPDLLESLMKTIRQRNLDCASCWFTPASKSLPIRFIHEFSCYYFTFVTWLGLPHSIGGCLMVRKSVHDAIEGFDETILVAEDQDYVCRIRKISSYVILREPRVMISTRRFETQGILKMCLKWIAIDFHRTIFGEIRSNRYHYFN